MQLKHIIYQKEGEIARIIFNRPEKLNAMDFPGQGGIQDDFKKVLDLVEEDDELKAVIIKGAGRSFCAGHDLNTVGFIYGMGTGKPGEKRASQRTRLRVDRRWLEGMHARLLNLNKVTNAQVQGHCIGEGLAIALCCDIFMAAETAQIGCAEQRLGFSGSGIGYIPILMLSVGVKRAREMMLTGRLLSGREAEAAGLCARCLSDDKLEEEVEKAAKAITLLPRDGLAIGKATTQLVYDMLGLGMGHTIGYISHTLFTNMVYAPGEFNFFRERREKGTKAAFHERDERYAGLVK
ncbi:MAG: enoyl-CoA hydratase/isomerase family protein [Chloroflexota bacterium]|mgnify:CR=1 FL=1